jgi:hypothetical protein
MGKGRLSPTLVLFWLSRRLDAQQALLQLSHGKVIKEYNLV